MAKTQTLNMNAVIFAGGVGTRMWPLSRTQTPKQFEPMIDHKSTLQLTVDRIRPEFAWEDIYISTGMKYKPLVKKQLPQIPEENIIGEPEMRDVAPAVGYLSAILAKKDPCKPMVILWSDHIMDKIATFKKILQAGGNYINQNPEKILFIGQKPRFANQNLGWIQRGKVIGKINEFEIAKFKTWHYQPGIQLARQFFKKADYVWNTGYFIAQPAFIFGLYRRFMPKDYQKILKLQQNYGTPANTSELAKIYPTLEKISFDDAILEKLEPEKAVVTAFDFGWSDIGNWLVLKEALQKSLKGNVTKGKVFSWECEDCLVYNYTDQLVTTIDLTNLVVVNTGDVLLVCTKESMKNIKNVVNHFKKDKNYQKYT